MVADSLGMGRSHDVARLLGQAKAQLRQAGIDTPALDAELLLAHVLEVERATLLAHPERRVDAADTARFYDLLARRVAHTPLAYLTGRRWFFGLAFEVTPDVLIPRPETELLVETAIAWLGRAPGASPRVIDVGTGSGAIAVSVAVHTPPTCRIFASDISSAALAVAQRNAERHGVAGRIAFLQGDLMAALPAAVDLILANLPYVADTERDALMPEVRDYEPALALFSGPHGLTLIQRLLAQAPTHLRSGGALLAEIGYTQRDMVLSLARHAFPTAHIDIHPDLANLPRLLTIQTTANCR